MESVVSTSHDDVRVKRGFYRVYGKRAFDIFFTILIGPVALLLIAGVALLMAAKGISPFFSQPRLGKSGGVFQLKKIRTMVPDADAKLKVHLEKNPEARIEWETTQKLKDDPRITAYGAFCRKSSLDELPQFWNVLKGEMSVIGPRPMLVEQRSMYPGNDYFRLRPGITGSWQVSDRNASSFASRARFDSEYNKNLSFMTDMKILFRTILVIFRCTGY
ncbi:sugar transferase [Phaeovulum sp.]|uniref:sugar transferase n=1 Tax=Phaeovulum sp. TaxID=2934796 RepID=UPI0039E57DF9